MRIFFGLFLVLLGLSAFFGSWVIKFLLAILLIWLGIRLMLTRSRHWSPGSIPSSHEASLNEVAIFSPIFKNVNTDDFRGGRIVCIFAGGVIDLSKASMKSAEASLEITSIFGGFKLIVPKNWRVEVSAAAVFGGHENRSQSEGSDQKVLRLTGAAIFGGVEITN